MNPNIVKAEYAVRGALAIRAEALRVQLERDPDAAKTLGFSSVISCNIGNPQQLKQKPITFYRQVAALTEFPELIDAPEAAVLFPDDVRARARMLLDAVGGSIGAYSHSQGIPLVRQHVAEFIGRRDGHPADPEHIFLTAGASPGVQLLMNTLISHDRVGLMIPIPQYPLYTAGVTVFNGRAVPYYLDEPAGWSLSVRELERSLQAARAEGTEVRALCVINPGNPTGQCLSEANIREIIEFTHREELVLLADEVYQANTYQADRPFVSFRKVLKDMGPSYASQELVSFHSISKGMIGECGRRGGYFECVNISQPVMDLFYKIASISLCPPVAGQLMVDLMVKPPVKGEPSYPLYEAELGGIYASLKRRATVLCDAFNAMEGVTCQKAQGAMYLFPSVRLPARFVDAMQAAGKSPDTEYCMALLNETGVCVISGTGFGQKAGTWHFRSTFLPPEDLIESFIGKLQAFHTAFLTKWR
ncbi:hypothetical protein CXG81DRAFT_8889 [Caulochytrium protostelioides]|uniref:Glutamate pyruvate transaminase n=1 Tax=Caulochytrium protostelioides TaxID=1555241 RepID=A0A4P9WV32_9FUNG|nr:PLP-dependent transferase [Caulochytrium protostelioides]RKP03882.1 hypothetical protein CXG81DRAFT_8889 [Caulochytrium protostelioides]|eukprot:RKP03882.1 hypothetical protein CXG81DRAFT_8889 [Caulochytrium protostelioides]